MPHPPSRLFARMGGIYAAGIRNLDSTTSGSLLSPRRLQLRIDGGKGLFERIALLLEPHIPHRRPVPTPVDGIHHGKRTSHAERKPQEEPDHRAGRKVHTASLVLEPLLRCGCRRRSLCRSRRRRRSRREDLQRVLDRERQTPNCRNQHNQPRNRNQRRGRLLYRCLSHLENSSNSHLPETGCQKPGARNRVPETGCPTSRF